MVGINSNSQIYVGKDYKSWTDIGIPTHTRVCLEVNTYTGTLNYFINDKHIKDRVVNVPKDVYFGV
jgi:predicted membrane protein